MRIGIDGRMIDESGIGRYVKNLLLQLQKLDSQNDYYIFLRRPQYDTTVYHNQNFHKVLADFSWYGWEEQAKFPRLLTDYKLDLVHFPHFNVPVMYKGRFVVTIHDLIHQHFQMQRASRLNPLYYKLKTKAYGVVFKNAVTNSEKILTPSKVVQSQLVKEWSINPEKIIVTAEAVEEKLIKVVQEMMASKSVKLVNKLGVKLPYLFYVGNVHPHKNVEQLIQGYLALKDKHPDLSLVLSGKENYFWQRLKAQYRHPGIFYTGYLTDQELVALYKNALVFVFPSLEEGFGIPILEAMACACPVVASDIAVFKEVGGEAAIYFKTGDLADMVEKIGEVFSNQETSSRLRKAGQARFSQFSWEKLTKKTMEVYASSVSA